jgi:phage N-6-adenine-methyltransferase
MEQITSLSGISQFFSAKSDEWGTPDKIFQLATEWWGELHCDVAATAENTKCFMYYTQEQNALNQLWSRFNWCNPPFSLADEFVEKAIHEAVHNNGFTTLLLKAAPETERFKQLRKHGCKFVFLSPRVQYVGAGKSCPFPSCLVRVERPMPTSVVNWYDITKEEWY